MEVEICMVVYANDKCERTIIYPEAMTSSGDVKELKRTGVQIMPRAIPCTSSDNLGNHRGSLGAFAPAGVRARKLWGLL